MKKLFTSIFFLTALICLSQEISPLDPPTNLQATVEGTNVHLTWNAPGSGGVEEELIYDNNTATNGYKYPGVTMSTHMSPSGPCQVLTLKYYTTNEGNDNQFYAKVFNWGGSQPGTTVLYNSTQTAADGEWIEVDVSGAGINVSDDFVVGFGSFTEEAFLGYDATLNNGRSWDFNESSQIWTSWDQAYLIRAVVLYPSGKKETLGGEITETINLITKNTGRNSSLQQSNNITPIPNQNLKLMGLLGYNVYRDSVVISSSPITNTYYDDEMLPDGTYSYTVTALYDEGESEPAGPVQATIGGSNVPPPTNLGGGINGDQVNLWWNSPGGGLQEELIYDNNEATSSYKYPGVTMSTRMSPAGSCQVLILKYYTTKGGPDDQFNARIFSWAGTQPGTASIHSQAVQAVNEAWLEVDVEGAEIYFTEDFVIGFGSISEDAYVAYDANFNNGRSWDFDESSQSWTSWNQAYLIRAVVLYGDGSIAELSGTDIPLSLDDPLHEGLALSLHEKGHTVIPVIPVENQFLKLLGLQGYDLYRNGIKINSSLILTTSTTDDLPGYGSYDYNVTAVYDEGESAFSSTVSFSYYFGIEELDQIDVNIYPNPADDILYIQSENEIHKLKLVGMNGVSVIAEEIYLKEYSLDVSSLAAGLYIISIETANGTASSRILVK